MFKKGDVVKYSTPGQGEVEFRFVVLEVFDGRVTMQLVCDWKIKPVEVVEEKEVCLVS